LVESLFGERVGRKATLPENILLIVWSRFVVGQNKILALLFPLEYPTILSDILLFFYY
jgi:hypothetical protein